MLLEMFDFLSLQPSQRLLFLNSFLISVYKIITSQMTSRFTFLLPLRCLWVHSSLMFVKFLFYYLSMLTTSHIANIKPWYKIEYFKYLNMLLFLFKSTFLLLNKVFLIIFISVNFKFELERFRAIRNSTFCSNLILKVTPLIIIIMKIIKRTYKKKAFSK